MKIKNFAALLLALAMMFSLCACGSQSAPAQDTPQPSEAQESAAPSEAPSEITVTDMIGRELTVTPGSYTRVVCIGAGALRMYSYIGDDSLLCGVEDIDNLTLEERPKMFDSVARPYVLAYGDVFSTLPSCGVGGPNAQAAEAEKILSCNPDIVISEYEDVEKEDALQEQLGVPVVTLKSGPNGVFDDAFSQSMTLLGQIFGEEEKAEALVSFIAAETAEIAERTASIADEDKPAVYVCGLGNWGTTNHLMTSQTYASFEVANIRNVVTDLGANGVVIGALTPDGELDLAQMRRMMACAGQMEVTLHRAFDMTRDPFRALEDAVSLGCRTILSSARISCWALRYSK